MRLNNLLYLQGHAAAEGSYVSADSVGEQTWLENNTEPKQLKTYLDHPKNWLYDFLYTG